MTTRAAVPADRRPHTAVLAIVLVSYLMIVLDISIVITALPQMHVDLGFSATGLSWVQNAYTLGFGGLVLLGARELLAHQIATALTGGAVMLALALVVVVALTVRPRTAAAVADSSVSA
jgi:MFS family permease